MANLLNLLILMNLVKLLILVNLMKLVILVSLVILVDQANLVNLVILANLCENMRFVFLESPPSQKYSICWFFVLYDDMTIYDDHHMII